MHLMGKKGIAGSSYSVFNARVRVSAKIVLISKKDKNFILDDFEM